MYFKVYAHGSATSTPFYPGFTTDLTSFMKKKRICIYSGYDRQVSKTENGTVLYICPCLNTDLGNRMYEHYHQRKKFTLTFHVSNSDVMRVELFPVLPANRRDDLDIDELLSEVEINRREYENN